MESCDIFGTDGMRGRVNQWPMTVDFTMHVGRVLATLFRKNGRRVRIVVGKDTRLSGHIFESALVSGICSMGGDVLSVGVLPTPAIAFFTRRLSADVGVAISASHNTYEDNGIKLFSQEGTKFSKDIEANINALLTKKDGTRPYSPVDDIGQCFHVDNATRRYVARVKRSIPKTVALQGIKVVVDCANGAAYKAAPMILRDLGATVFPINDMPDGININRDCGAVYPAQLASAVLAHRADMGVAYDGDADRMVLADENGCVVHGDALLATFTFALLESGQLRGRGIVTTQMSNTGLEKVLQSHGLHLVRAPIGDQQVFSEMVAGGYNFGGETSGHFIFLDHSPTGDGLLASLQILSLMWKTGKRVSDLIVPVALLPQKSINLRVKAKPPLDQIPGFHAVMADSEKQLGKNGRIIARYSGTEPIFRVMVEGENPELVSHIAETIAGVVKREAVA